VAEANKKILIIEGDLDVAEMLRAYFRVQGYEINTVKRGEDGLQAIQNSRPDIVILDVRLPDMDGYEVARGLHANRRTADIPIIFITEKSDRSERLQGLALGVDDYIAKPIDVQELRLRIRNALRRIEQDNLTNPVTGLPDGRLVGERVSACLHKLGWSMLIISLENMDIFREAYGFVASDDVLRAVSLMVQNTVKEIGGQEDFLGHLDPWELVLITGEERGVELEDRIRSRLEQSLNYFYPIRDREKTVKRGERLVVKIGILKAGEANFASTDDIKLALQQKKH
jgi:DNA-binding response OmpR family regulator